MLYKERSGRVIARVHQFLRLDGSLGGDGFPDPKILYDTAEHMERDDTHGDEDECSDCASWKPKNRLARLALEPYRKEPFP